MKKTNKVYELLKKYPKYCPKCKTYQPEVWHTCDHCKTTLVDGKKAYKKNRLIRILINISIIFLIILATYGIQKNERKYYREGIKSALHGKFGNAKEEFTQALLMHPLCKFIVVLIQKTELRQSEKKEATELIIDKRGRIRLK